MEFLKNQFGHVIGYEQRDKELLIRNGTSDADDSIEVYRSAQDVELAITFFREEWGARGYKAEAKAPSIFLGSAPPAATGGRLVDASGQSVRTRPRPVKRLKASDRLPPEAQLQALVGRGVLDGAEWDGKTLVGGSCLAADLAEVLASHAKQSLRRLIVDAEEDGDWKSAASALTKKAPASLRQLTLCDFRAVEEFHATRGNPTKLLAALTQLETLTLRAGQLQLDALATCGLRRLEVCASALSAKSLETLATTSWPRLEALELWIGAADEGATCTVDGFSRLVGSAGLPALRELALNTCEFGNAAVQALLDSPLLPRLERLELSRSVLDDAGVGLLTKAADRLRHLKGVVLDEVRAAPGAIEGLRAAGVTVTSAERDRLRFESVAQFVPLS